MKQILSLLGVGVAGVVALTGIALAQVVPNSAPILIVEVQTGSANSANEEFIELYNVSDQDVDLSSWRVEYYSAASAVFGSPSRSVPLNGVLVPGGRFLATSTNYLPDLSDATFSSTLAKNGGHLRLVHKESPTDETWTEVDRVGWGTAVNAEVKAASAPAEGYSAVRKLSLQNSYVDTNDNSTDFEVATSPSPESNNPQPEVLPETTTVVGAIIPEPTAKEEPEVLALASEQPEAVVAPVNILPVIITELLPNPASPATDANDEFVELYNPNQVDINLDGYKLQTGTNFTYTTYLDGQVIGANTLLVLYSKDTSLALSNSGGRARLVDPSGAIMSQSSLYETIDEPYAWALTPAGGWLWTSTPTPGSVNAIVAPVTPVAATSTTTTKAVAVKKSTKPKVLSASAKSSKPKSATAKKTTSAAAPASQTASTTKTAPPIHPMVLAVVGILAVGYAIYEYRFDIANLFKKRK